MTALSVVMPVYNGARTLDRALGSIDAGGAEIEVIAVDQASTDGSRDILSAWRDRLPLQIIDAPDSTGWTTTTNRGLEAASSPLIAMLHQDDIWLDGFARAALQSAADWPEAALWVHGAQFTDDRNRRLGRFSPPFGPRARLIPSAEAQQILMVQNTVALPAAVFRRDAAMADGGLDPALWYTADWDLWLRLAAAGPVGWRPEPMAAFRLHAGSQTMTGSRDLADFARQLAEPVERARARLPLAGRAETIALAEASNQINLTLAARHHGAKPPYRELIRHLVKLGPIGVTRLLRRSRLIARVWPRLRLRLGL